MFPQEPDVFLVQADGILERDDFAPAIQHIYVEVADRAETVAAQLQRVGHRTDAIFPDVEGVLAVIRLARIAVGHDQLADRRPIEHWSLLAVIVVADRVQHQPFPRREADAETPLLPAHFVALDSEAGTVGLFDLQRLEILPRLFNVLARQVGRLRRQRHYTRILDTEH